MNIFYWFTVLGNLQKLFAFLTFFGTVAVILLSIALVINVSDYENEKMILLLKRFHKLAIIVWSISIVGIVFTPSTKELYTIYGIGTVIDFVKEDPTAKKLPHKAIVALDKWVESFNEEQKNRDKE